MAKNHMTCEEAGVSPLHLRKPFYPTQVVSSWCHCWDNKHPLVSIQPESFDETWPLRCHRQSCPSEQTISVASKTWMSHEELRKRRTWRHQFLLVGHIRNGSHVVVTHTITVAFTSSLNLMRHLQKQAPDFLNLSPDRSAIQRQTLNTLGRSVSLHH